MEEWRRIERTKYEVSKSGEIRSYHRGYPKMIRPGIAEGGHLFFILYDGGKPRNKRIHVAVLEEFVGPRPKGMQACHNDGNPKNNRLDNLRWDTPKANYADAVKHGVAHLGERHYRAKITTGQAIEIKRLRENGESLVAIGKRFGISMQSVSKIHRGTAWAKAISETIGQSTPM